MARTTPTTTSIVCCLSLTGVVLCDMPSANARVTQVVISAIESPTFDGISPFQRRRSCHGGEHCRNSPSIFAGGFAD
jgi:hypothetical protein